MHILYNISSDHHSPHPRLGLLNVRNAQKVAKSAEHRLPGDPSGDSRVEWSEDHCLLAQPWFLFESSAILWEIMILHGLMLSDDVFLGWVSSRLWSKFLGLQNRPGLPPIVIESDLHSLQFVGAEARAFRICKLGIPHRGQALSGPHWARRVGPKALVSLFNCLKSWGVFETERHRAGLSVLQVFRSKTRPKQHMGKKLGHAQCKVSWQSNTKSENLPGVKSPKVSWSHL